MNIALIGFGKMGQEIANLSNDHQIRIIVDPDQTDNLSEKANELSATLCNSIEEADFEEIDVAIEFTHPSVCLDNIKALAEKGVNIVVGTTGWYDHMEEVQKIAKKSGIGLLWASNFSIGVHLFWRIVTRGAEVMNSFEEYDAFGHEFHHNQKADSPSGTARTTAEILVNNLDRKDTIATETMDRKIKPNELHFTSTRGGNINGTHQVLFDSPADTIEIKHTARNRSGFASGALKCAEWLKGRTGFFSIEDYLKDLHL